MSNLIKLSEVKSLNTFNFNQIADAQQRESAQTICDRYDAIHADLKQQASEILKTNTVELGKTVYALKHSLDHGNFNLDKKKQAALVQVGQAITDGELTDAALEMLAVTEPRAAQKFLKADEKTKSSYVATFEDTGKAPSQRSFTPQQQEFIDRRRQSEAQSHNYERHLASAFEDSPASPFYKGEPVDEMEPCVIETEVTAITSEPTVSIELDEVTDPTEADIAYKAAYDAMHVFLRHRPTRTPEGRQQLQRINDLIDAWSGNARR